MLILVLSLLILIIITIYLFYISRSVETNFITNLFYLTFSSEYSYVTAFIPLYPVFSSEINLNNTIYLGESCNVGLTINEEKSYDEKRLKNLPSIDVSEYHDRIDFLYDDILKQNFEDSALVHHLIKAEILQESILSPNRVNFNCSIENESQLRKKINDLSKEQVNKVVQLWNDSIKEIDVSKVTEYLLEVEILAANIAIAGERVQRRSIYDKILLFEWNLCFNNSGNHEVAFLISVKRLPEERIVFQQRNSHNIKVYSLDHLTSRQIKILKGLSAIGSLILAIITCFKLFY